MQRIFAATIGALALAIAAPALGQGSQSGQAAPTPRPSPIDQVQIGATELAPGLFELTGYGGNMALLIGPEGPVLVDAQFAPVAGKIKAKVAELAGGAKVKTLINTHWHGDHTNGNPEFGREGAEIYAQENVLKRLTATQVSTLFGRETPPLAKEGLPTRTFKNGMVLKRNGEMLEIRHYPRAHTDGDVTVYFRERDVLHIGDLLFNGYFPFIDIDSGGTVDGYIAAMEAVLAKLGPNTKVIAGHGPLGDKAAVQRNLENLKLVRARVAGQVARGLSLEQAIAEKPLADLDDPWGKFFITQDKMTEIVFKDLSRGR